MFKTSLKLSLIAILSLGLTGCFSKGQESLAKKDYNNAVDEMKSPNKNELKEITKETLDRRGVINLKYTKKMSKVLGELSDLAGVLYVLDQNSPDVDVPTITNSNLYSIATLEELASYMESRTNYTLGINNKLDLNKPKIISVSHKANKNFKTSEVMVEIKNANVAETLDRVAQATGYNVAFYQDDDNTPIAMGVNSINQIDYIQAKHISFNKDVANAYDILNYMAKSLNIYIDVDHYNKLIKIKKYKVEYFKLFMNNLEIAGSLGAGSVNSGSTASTSSSKEASDLATQASIKVFNELEENIKKALGANNDFDNKKSYILLDKVTGEVSVKSTKNSMEQVQEMITRFNQTYGRMIEFRLEVYEIIVNRNSEAGIDVTGALANLFKTSKGLTFATANTSLTPNVTLANSDATNKAALAMMNEFGTVVNQKSYIFYMHNHIPYSRTKATSITYTKKLTLTQTGTTSAGTPTYTTTREVGEINDGFVFKAKPMIDGDDVSLNLNVAFSSLVNMASKTVGTDSYEEPEVSNDSFSGELKIKNGERFVIDSLNVKTKSENYNGVIPLKDFIIGGDSNNKYLNKEIVLVGSVKIKE